ncbi:DUF2238 domain-containing protein [Shewanella sp. D64]|uniref:DUF2238 domain-containing protein n=1 Tax=unclassified Shewanella TaxID=196818 RepID=UPI0022BA15FE|nr:MULTISPECIES: DUF2238 domain-containing protein [unclassified Shewanella]MEC4724505.1 DUF2238 domain-containing protein [Shewanella sp. D64]MEC4736718.1 DUF2238 domain-containing protein [Shewanella sp. E94]WBJ94613.1 DUF2238 domain-containing protein [Shewanella sp. MTB7]
MNKQHIWLAIFFSVLIWSAIDPKDQFTWFLEVAPVLIALPLLALTRKRFPLTPLLYVLILIHCVILMVGGHYTYAEVPLFDWLADVSGSDRNNYDKLGHFAQGFIPALIAREVFIRNEVLKSGSWCNFICVCFALALSAFYELIEWWVALLTGEDAEAFLGTQGYIWDTQSDMGMALFGAILGLLFLVTTHDKQLSQLKG